jgi:hypothetical protein
MEAFIRPAWQTGGLILVMKYPAKPQNRLDVSSRTSRFATWLKPGVNKSSFWRLTSRPNFLHNFRHQRFSNRFGVFERSALSHNTQGLPARVVKHLTALAMGQVRLPGRLRW